MKYLKLFLTLLFIPFLVLAEECDISKITITSLVQKGITGNTEVTDDLEFKNRNIKLNLKMYEVGDSITYDMTIKNDSEEDYMIDEDTFKTDSEYIEYSLLTNDNSNVVKAKSTKDLVLTVEYKKEVDDSVLTNNKFDASNNLTLSMNTKDKEEKMDVITTENIKNSVDPVKVSNPLTSASSILLLSFAILTTLIIIYLNIRNKNRYGKYFLLVISFSLVSTVYAICKADIEVKSNIEIEKKPTLNKTIIGLSEEENSCITKYEGEVTDEVGKTVIATNVYFDKCMDKRNVIFGGLCWQVIRTTETGGTKIIYNGEPENGKCESTRGTHKGIKSGNFSTEDLSAEYLYSSSFTYNTINDSYTLVDPENAIWNDTTYENLLGKFTCKTTSDTCSKLYQISEYISNTEAKTLDYYVLNTGYSLIGMAGYNKNYSVSPASVGYMYNNTYKAKSKSALLGEVPSVMFGSSFVYDTNTNTYTLSGTTPIINNWYSNYENINTAHYTCWNTTGICSTISYVHSFFNYSIYYIDMSEGKSESNLLTEMLLNNDKNKNNTSVKSIIDSWYSQNLAKYTKQIEDTVYCNNRTISNLGGFNPNGGSIKDTDRFLKFPNYDAIDDLTCESITDQFAVSNNKAKLTYPVALAEAEEINNINDTSLLKSSNTWYTMSPAYFTDLNSSNRVVNTNGMLIYGNVNDTNGIRPVISLKQNSKIFSGTGSETDPWIIK